MYIYLRMYIFTCIHICFQHSSFYEYVGQVPPKAFERDGSGGARQPSTRLRRRPLRQRIACTIGFAPQKKFAYGKKNHEKIYYKWQCSIVF